VFRSQPNLKIGKRAVPANYLNDKSKDEARDMKDLDRPIFDSPNGSEEKKEDPKKMGQNYTICKNFINHWVDESPWV
jgi:hypothetical protein